MINELPCWATEKEEKDFIISHLNSLIEFNEMLDIRYEIRKKADKDGKDSPLRGFYILNGQYHIDKYAQIGLITSGMDEIKKVFTVPLVCNEQEMRVIYSKYDKHINAIPIDIPYEEAKRLHEEGRPYKHDVMISLQSKIPEVNTRCPYCGKGWTIDNMTDIVHRQSDFDFFPIKTDNYDFTGQRIKYFWDFFEKSQPVKYMHQYGNQAIINEKHEDNSPNPDYPTLKKNPNGFNNVEVDENYILEENDKVGFWFNECYHVKCNRTVLNRENLKGFEEIFHGAEIKYNKITHTQNEYCGDPACSVCSDWFIFRTEYGDIKIGWRKRVMVIDWSSIGKVDGEVLFDGNRSTYSTNYIHAWDNDEAIKGLMKLRDAFITIKT